MGKIVLEDFYEGNGHYKVNLAYLNKEQVKEIESLVSKWKPTDEYIKSCIEMCLTDANEQRFKDYGTNLKDCLDWLEKQSKHKLTHEDICKSYGIQNIGEFSDGYHTFNGLYRQRMVLFAVLVKTYKNKAWKSWKHEDGLDCFGGGWFIVGIDTPAGTYTYHYESKDWDKFDCQILDKAKHWDGHDENDVERLFSLIEPRGKITFEAVREEKVDNQNCVKPTNKIKPKFHEGDWVISNKNNNNVYQVERIDNNRYYLRHYLGGTLSVCFDSELIRLWTIQDAKDGDVLSDGTAIFIFKDLLSDGSVMSYCDYDTDSGESDDFCPLSVNLMCLKITPATKEQRDKLEKAMADAGYRWNPDEKKMEKIEQKSQRMASAEAKEAL